MSSSDEKQKQQYEDVCEREYDYDTETMERFVLACTSPICEQSDSICTREKEQYKSQLAGQIEKQGVTLRIAHQLVISKCFELISTRHDVTSLNISSIPNITISHHSRYFSSFVNLTHVDMSDSIIDEGIIQCLPESPNLSILIMSNCTGFSTLRGISKLKNLTVLDISYCDLEDVYELGELTELRYLDASVNNCSYTYGLQRNKYKIKHLDRIGCLNKLQVLYLSGRGDCDEMANIIYEIISRLDNLEEIYAKELIANEDKLKAIIASRKLKIIDVSMSVIRFILENPNNIIIIKNDDEVVEQGDTSREPSLGYDGGDDQYDSDDQYAGDGQYVGDDQYDGDEQYDHEFYEKTVHVYQKIPGVEFSDPMIVRLKQKKESHERGVVSLQIMHDSHGGYYD